MSSPVTANKKVTIAVLTKYKDVLIPFIKSLKAHNIDIPVVCIRDKGDINDSDFPNSWVIINGPDQFSMAGNGNLGLMAVTEGDILYCGDDVRFIHPDTISRLQEVAYANDKIGILSPRIIGRGSPTLVNPLHEVMEVPPIEMWFPCIYIKREVIDKVGYLDEQFSNFGCDDLDYCIRVKQAGYKLCVTSKVAVKHEASPEGGPTTFVKNIGVDRWQSQQREAQHKLIKKYGVQPTVMDKVVRTGDVSLLTYSAKETDFQKRVSAGYRPTNEECEEFLKTRWLFIGTPAYGGTCNINYVNSLLSLVNLCHNLGIKYTISFTQNESLVTRARNKLTDDMLNTTGATDLVWVDADISFDARDIITIMMRDEGVIGLPCSRKNLRVDRVVQAVKKHPDKNYTVEELEELMGEFVLNFPPDAVPASLSLADLVEVKHVGTGLMRIKRETLQTIMEKIPNRWIKPMTGEVETDNIPMYMFFQAEPDFDVKEGETPYYISEDYSFCQLARNSGVKVYIAPWAKTTHTGTYVFRGNLVATGTSGLSLR